MNVRIEPMAEIHYAIENVAAALPFRSAGIQVQVTPMNQSFILDLPPLLAERLKAICASTGRTTASHVLEALDWYFAELRETKAAEEVWERIRTGEESTRSLDDIAADLGLN